MLLGQQLQFGASEVFLTQGVLDAQAISPMPKKSVSQEMMEECRPNDPDYKGFLLL